MRGAARAWPSTPLAALIASRQILVVCREGSCPLPALAAPVAPRIPFRFLTVAAALFMVVLQALLQFVLTPDTQAPWPLFLLFTGLWIFGAGMLMRFPRFGAAGTAAWGLLSAIGAWQTHAAINLENTLLIAGSLIASILAVLTLVTKDW